ncbi:hypothetical protein BS47DRAFT_1388499 [Hydnum rufescens UP504]|uniref:Uncharacterized protein n=1 Tax=Hydnum rufescens UP504 TaxID=1448309 RepID=A0A9P6E1D5_9AGAM|nr:hypothetical protein BS47DRAFT_1388499 [Hydnum rufescens UP504]
MPATRVTLVTDLLASDPHFMCTMSIKQLCTSIQGSRLERAGRVVSLIRFEQLRGFRHQFLVLKIARTPDDGETMWLRLDRGPKPENVTPRSSVSRFTPCDSATISSSEAQLLRGLRLEIKAEVIFPVDGPTGGDLRELLNILSQESPEYRLWGVSDSYAPSSVYSQNFPTNTYPFASLGELQVVLLGRARILDPFLLWRAEVGNAIPSRSWEEVPQTYCGSFSERGSSRPLTTHFCPSFDIPHNSLRTTYNTVFSDFEHDVDRHVIFV